MTTDVYEDWTDLPDDDRPAGGQTPRPPDAQAGVPRYLNGPVDRMLGVRHGLVPWRPYGRNFGPER